MVVVLVESHWHPRVRPAYTRTSWMWVGFFAARAIWQWRLYLDANTVALGVARVAALCWPALLVLLIATYVLGRRWLTALEGPSVDESRKAHHPLGRPGNGILSPNAQRKSS